MDMALMRAGPEGLMRWACGVVFAEWPWWEALILLLVNPAMVLVSASLGLILLPVVTVAAVCCAMPWVALIAQYLRRFSVRFARCSSPLMWVAVGRMVVFPPQFNSVAVLRLALSLLVGHVHLPGTMCSMASFAAAFVLAGDLPLGLCKAACLAALVWPTFGRKDHPGYGQTAIELPEPVGTPPDG